MTNEQKTDGPDLAERIFDKLDYFFGNTGVYGYGGEDEPDIAGEIRALTAPIEAELAAAKKEIAELRAFAERFPKTADGVRIYLGMKVWAGDNCHEVMRLERDKAVCWMELGGGARATLMAWEPASFYSTEAAMRAAKEGK